jgi:hypothetical protein
MQIARNESAQLILPQSPSLPRVLAVSVVPPKFRQVEKDKNDKRIDFTSMSAFLKKTELEHQKQLISLPISSAVDSMALIDHAPESMHLATSIDAPYMTATSVSICCPDIASHPVHQSRSISAGQNISTGMVSVSAHAPIRMASTGAVVSGAHVDLVSRTRRLRKRMTREECNQRSTTLLSSSLPLRSVELDEIYIDEDAVTPPHKKHGGLAAASRLAVEAALPIHAMVDDSDDVSLVATQSRDAAASVFATDHFQDDDAGAFSLADGTSTGWGYLMDSGGSDTESNDEDQRSPFILPFHRTLSEKYRTEAE